MSDQKCKCCGEKFVSGGYCFSNSKTKKHIAMSNGRDCVYCGKKHVNNASCFNSPDKKCKLQD